MSNWRTLYSSFRSSWPSLKLSNFFPVLKTTAQESVCLLFSRISHTLMYLLFLLVSSFPSLTYFNPAWPCERWFQVSLPLCSCPQWSGVWTPPVSVYSFCHTVYHVVVFACSLPFHSVSYYCFPGEGVGPIPEGTVVPHQSVFPVVPAPMGVTRSPTLHGSSLVQETPPPLPLSALRACVRLGGRFAAPNAFSCLRESTVECCYF